MKVTNTVLLVVNLFAFSLLLCSTNPVAGHYYVQCTQTGGAKGTYWGSQWFLYEEGQLMGIGTEKFRNKYAAVMSAQFQPNLDDAFIGNDGVEKQDCPYSWHKGVVRDIQLCDEKDERVNMRFYAVKQTDSNGIMHTLNGWLHIEIELVDKSDEIRFLYAQMVDSYYNAIGEFVTNPSEQCPPTNPSIFISPTPYQVIPCEAVGSREVKPSQAVWMVAKQDLFHQSTGTSTDPLYMPIQKLGRGVHFTWRLDEYWCNRHFKFRPEVYIVTSKNINLWEKNTDNGTAVGDNSFKDHRVYRKNPNYWLRSEWVGAADIKHPHRSELQCDKLVTNAVGVTGGLTSEAPWIKETVKSTVKQEYFHHGFLVNDVLNVCQVDLRNGDPENHAVFGGRCEKPYGSDYTSHDFVQSCNTNSSSEEFHGLNISFTKYKTYVNESQYIRFKQCSQPCRAPETEKDAIDISNIIINKTSTDLNPVGGLSHKTRTKHSILRFWRARKYHGLFSIFCSMFINPVSVVAARYLKETFMEKQYFSIHLWYWFHVCCSIAAGTISITSQVTLYSSIGSWGRSLHWAGIIHHSFGWLANIVFVIISTLGAFRNGSIKWRKLMLRIHLIVGFVFLIAISAKIPESPLLHHCDVDGFPIGTALIYYVVGGWILVDACFHLLMTRIEHIVERRIMVVHPWHFPTIPILSPQSHQDMRCSYCRRYIFYAYIGMSFLFTWTAMLHLTIRSQPQKCSFGKTSCKAALGCTTAAFAMCEKLNYKNCER